MYIILQYYQLMQQLFITKILIRSKYFNQWQVRIVSLDFSKSTIGISQHGAHIFKYFHLNDLKIQQKSSGILIIKTRSGRKYQLRGQNVPQLLQAISSHHLLHQLLSTDSTSSMTSPRKINYHEYTEASYETTERMSLEIKKSSSKQEVKEKQRIFKRQKSYLKEEDWAVNEKQGGLVLISQEKKKNQGKILKFILTKFITTGSFMGISFPVFAMKPESILQTYCKSFAAAPLLFSEDISSPIERMKRFVCLSFTISRLFSDMDKPFNPTLGQTYQAEIGGCLYSAQQTSHHPPQSSIYLQGKGYKIYGTLQLVANISINSATGMIQGDIIIQFKDGQKIIGRSFNGAMSGFVLGQNKFKPFGACYAYDPANRTICSFKNEQKDIFKGFIGKLNNKSQNNFQQMLKKKERFTQFQSFNKQDYEAIYSKLQGNWSHFVKFDNQIYLDFDDPKWLPYQPQCQDIQILDSDSRHRKDINLRALGKIQESQAQKQRLEEQERTYRKQRSNYSKKHHPTHH